MIGDEEYLENEEEDLKSQFSVYNATTVNHLSDKMRKIYSDICQQQSQNTYENGPIKKKKNIKIQKEVNQSLKAINTTEFEEIRSKNNGTCTEELMEVIDTEILDSQKLVTQQYLKMLLISQNGIQNILTFDIPAGVECTIQDLIDQTNTQFSRNPKIHACVNNPDIDYIVDYSNDESSTDAQNVTENLIDKDATGIEPNTSKVCQPKKKIKKEPLYKKGMLAYCPFCKMTASDFNYCMRCKNKLPENVKSIPICPQGLNYDPMPNCKEDGIVNKNKNEVPNKDSIFSSIYNINADSNEIILIYPRPPEVGGIEIRVENVKCLLPNKYLNDIIVDFYLKYILSECLEETDRENIYIFNTFFYTRLVSDGEFNYEHIKKWTKNVNIIEKDILVFPINKNKHWFFIAVCNPFLANNMNCQLNNKIMKTSEITVESDSSHVHKTGKVPSIIVFDSLSSGNHYEVISNIKRYIYHEHEKNSEISNAAYFEDNFIQINAKVPQQSNGTDCGIYMLQYVEIFLQNQGVDYAEPFKYFEDRFREEVILKKRADIQKLIIYLSEQYNL